MITPWGHTFCTHPAETPVAAIESLNWHKVTLKQRQKLMAEF